MYKSLGEYEQYCMEEIYDVPEYLADYVDYERKARDMEMNGDIFSIELGYQEVHVFWGR